MTRRHVASVLILTLVLPCVSRMASALQFTPLASCGTGSSIECGWAKAALSPDGQWLLYEEAIGYPPVYEYYPTVQLRSLDGSVSMQLGGSVSMTPAWSPRGDAVVYRLLTSFYPIVGVGIAVQPVSTATPPVVGAAMTLVEDAMAGNPVWSPDGDFVAYDRHGGGIWVVAASGGGTSQLVSDGRSPSWGPDGRIVFERDGDLWTRDPLGVVHHLTDTPFQERQPSWSPRGDWIAFVSDEAGTWDIWVVFAGGGTRVRLTTDKPAAFGPSWSADGDALLFTTHEPFRSTIWMATELPDFTISVEQAPWSQVKQLYR